MIFIKQGSIAFYGATNDVLNKHINTEDLLPFKSQLFLSSLS
ncbi:hypothetical protein GMMP15_1070006 [Candidatus Magnetomoraceae bacterium gMMP-15]